MQISNKSWHYRLYEKYTSNDFMPPPSNLCPYMRGVLRGGLAAFFLIALGALLTVFTVDPIIAVIMLVADIPLEHYFWDDEHFWSSLATAVLVPALLLVFGGLFGCAKIRDKYLEYKQNKPYKEPKEPTPFWTLVKGLHDKVCPKVKMIK